MTNHPKDFLHNVSPKFLHIFPFWGDIKCDTDQWVGHFDLSVLKDSRSLFENPILTIISFLLNLIALLYWKLADTAGEYCDSLLEKPRWKRKSADWRKHSKRYGVVDLWFPPTSFWCKVYYCDECHSSKDDWVPFLIISSGNRSHGPFADAVWYAFYVAPDRPMGIRRKLEKGLVI